MKKNILLGLFASLFVLASCDYNEDNFEGFDNNPVTDVVHYEGQYTGKYPDAGYFSVTEGNEAVGKAAIEKALNETLAKIFPYSDKGSSAKVTLKVASVLPRVPDKEPQAKEDYTLVDADYISMGTASGQPGKYKNFDEKMDINFFLTAFCATKYAAEAKGTIIKITYKYYANKETTTPSRFYVKGASEWNEYSSFVPDKKYTLTDADYKLMGSDAGEPGENNQFTGSDDVINGYITLFLKNKYAYVAKDGLTASVTYKANNNMESSIYRFNGEQWSSYDPTKEVVTGIADRITVMKFDGTSWKLTNLISGVIRQTMGADGYAALVAWVKENKPAFMSTLKGDEEYYFGASAGYKNINNAYNTWSKYYNVDGYLDDLENDEIQAIMDQRMAEGLSNIVLPLMVTNPNPDMSYEVIYKVYAGRGAGDYGMSFYYNPVDDKYEWDELAPVKK